MLSKFGGFGQQHTTIGQVCLELVHGVCLRLLRSSSMPFGIIQFVVETFQVKPAQDSKFVFAIVVFRFAFGDGVVSGKVAKERKYFDVNLCGELFGH